MAALLLYLACALAALRLASRTVTPISWRATAALAAMPLALTGWAMVRGEVLGPIDLVYHAEPFQSQQQELGFVGKSGGILTDVYSQMIPWKSAVRYALAQREWPLYNPFILGGDPLAASAQPAPYSPILLLSLLLPLADSLAFCSALVLLAAALSAFLFARELGCGEGPSLAAAAGFMLSGFVLFFLGWPQAQAAAFLPLVLAGVRRSVHAPGLAALALLTTALVLTLLAGHPETAVHVVLVGLLYAGFELWGSFELWPLRRELPAKAVACGLGAGVLALLLTAVFLLPIAEALPQTAEYAFRRSYFAHQDRSADWPVALANLVPSFVPFVAGKFGLRAYQAPWDWALPATACTGSAFLGLAAYGLLYSRRRERLFLAGLAAFGWLAGVSAPGVADLLASLPLLDISLNQRLVFAAGLAIPALAALGLQEWLERGADCGLPRFQLAALQVTVFVAFAAGLAWLLPYLAKLGLPAGFLALHSAVVLGPPLVLATLACTRWARPAFVPLLLALTLGQRAIDSHDLFHSFPKRMFYPAVEPLTELPATAEPYRVTAAGYGFLPNTSTLYELEDVRGYQAIYHRRLVDTFPLWCTKEGAWFNRVDDFSRPFLSFLNVRYALISTHRPDPAGWRRAGQHGASVLWENPRVLPRAFVPPRVRRGGDERQVLAEMNAETDFAARAWISHPGQPAVGEPRGRRNGPGTVTIRRRGLGYRLRAVMERPGWVVVSVTAWAGWQARSGDEELPLAFANHAFVGIRAPRGESTIDLVYRPRSFVVGRWVSGVTLVGLILVVAARRWLRMRCQGPLPAGGRFLSWRSRSSSPAQ